MRKRLLIGCLLLVGLGIVAMATPRISVSPMEYDFGSIGQGYMVKHTFMLENTGSDVLEIVRVRASCGCTTTDLPTDRLAPGESVPLEVLVLADHGTSKNVSIYVYTNGPDIFGVANDDRTEHDIKLYVKGAITPKQDFELAPFELAYDMMIVVDVRDEAAYTANHLMGAINIPVAELADRMDILPKGAWIIVYDLAGEAADEAVQTLTGAGYMSAFYLQGGLSRWVAVQGDLYFASSAPLPEAGRSVVGGSSGRPWGQGDFRSDYYLLVDVRDAAAYAAGHLAGAVNIPTADLPQWVDRISQTTKIIVYDDDGSTALAAYQVLENAGFTRPYVLLGGLNEWIYQYGDAYVLTQ